MSVNISSYTEKLINIRCVHAPLTSEIEYQNFVTENEQFFAQVVKEAPIHSINHLLRKVLSERYPSFAHSQPHHKYYQNNHTTNLSKPPAFTAQPYNPYSPNQTIHTQYPNYYTHSFPQLAQTSYLPPNLYAKPIFQNNGHHQIPLNFNIRPSMNQESLNFQASKTIENIEIKHIAPSIDQLQPLSTFHAKVNSSQSSEKFKSTMEVINEGNFVKENNVALNERKIDATVERIAKLVELSKSQQINKEKIRKNNENLKNNFDPNYIEQKNQLDAQEKITNKNKLESPKKEETSQEEKKEINEEGQDIKNKFDHDSNNSVLLKKLKDSLHLNGEHPMDVKDLVNLYLKLYKK